jgi:hypothetical protein
MCFACKSDERCDHSLNECAAVQGDYCVVCHHTSALATPARKSTPLGPRKDRGGMFAVLREIRQRRGRRS